jgi:GMP synthase (glutamine-hydrolysing)
MLLVVDYGSPTARLIVVRLRALGYAAELVPFDTVPRFPVRGVILSGGPDSVKNSPQPHKNGSPRLPRWLNRVGCPVLGIGYGAHLLAGPACVRPAEVRSACGPARVVEGCVWGVSLTQQTVWMAQQDQTIHTVPVGWSVAAQTPACPTAAAVRNDGRRAVVQFHPEVTHTEVGNRLLEAFAQKCGASRNWTSENLVTNALQRIRTQVGTGKVIVGLQSGVESAVCAALVSRALLPTQVQYVLVDTGLFRTGELAEIVNAAPSGLALVRAADVFLSALQGLPGPHAKRRAVRRVFSEVLKRHVASDVTLLVHATVARTGRGSSRIAPGPPALRLELLEPLRHLFKDEVYRLGQCLGLPPALPNLQPISGLALCVRGPVSQVRLETVRQADRVWREALRASNSTASSHVVLTEGNKVILHSSIAPDWPVPTHAAVRILNEVPDVKGVLHDLTPASTIE